MPHLSITSDVNGLRLHVPGSVALPRVLRGALAADPGPVTIMIHGYKYQPGHPRHCPHRSLLAHAPKVERGRMISWPRHLGLRGQAGAGLSLSFGWSARGSIWRAFDKAQMAGAQLAELIEMIGQIAPDRPIHLVAHSLGVRVALAALKLGRPGRVDKAIFLAGAEFQNTAQTALLSPGGASCAVLNVTSRENDLFDFLLERLVKAPRPGNQVLGSQGLNVPNCTTLQLDDPHSLSALKALGFAIAAPRQLVCHWSPYLRPGVFPLYRAFLSGQVEFATLRDCLPSRTAPRWSRFARSVRVQPTPAAPPISL